jgi:hypothetical protein
LDDWCIYGALRPPDVEAVTEKRSFGPRNALAASGNIDGHWMIGELRSAEEMEDSVEDLLEESLAQLTFLLLCPEVLMSIR